MNPDEKFLVLPLHVPIIDWLADHLAEQYLNKGLSLDRVAVVFGGRRPALFLRRALSQRVRRAFIPPQCFTIDGFIDSIVRQNNSYTKANALDSAFLIYSLVREHKPKLLKKHNSFSTFLPWAREVLSFIDQTDLELISDEKLVAIKANAEVGYDVPDDINDLLQNLVVLKEYFHAEMKKRGQMTRGMIYKEAATHVATSQWPQFDKIIFAQFFYLNRCEEQILNVMRLQKNAQLIFQGSAQQWPTFKRLSARWDISFDDNIKSVPQPDVTLHVAASQHGQVSIACDLLKNIDARDKTVVVLPSPEMIVPLISMLTAVEQNFNISMGYPLKRSGVYALIAQVFKTQQTRKDDTYYARDYLALLRHPLVKNLKWHDDAAVSRILVHKIEEILVGEIVTTISGSAFITLEQIEDCETLYVVVQESLQRLNINLDRRQLKETIIQLHNVFCRAWEEIDSVRRFVSSLRELLDVLTERSFMEYYPLNVNITQKLFEMIDELSEVAFIDEKFDGVDLFKIFESYASSQIVAFSGSPLKGLQVLGLFETRALHFDNVIVLDVNEGVLPKLNLYEPLIPREVMISLNLDRLEQEEEIQRYQLMRLQSSAKKVHLIYEENREKERSRFVEEVLWKQEKGNPTQRMAEPTKFVFSADVGTKKRTVKKTPAMIAQLRKQTFSASSINAYLRNPMEFYFTYVLGLREQDDLLDEPEAKQIGTLIHAVLEKSFKPFLGKAPIINEGFKARVFQNFDDMFNQKLGRNVKSEAFLLKTVARERLKQFLDNESEAEDRRVKEIMFLESKFEDVLPFSNGSIKFKFIVDRVDRLEDGTIIIIDYKTGSSDKLPKALEQLATLTLNRDNIYKHIQSFQIPLYYYYLHKKFPNDFINAGLYSLRTNKVDKFIKDPKETNPQEIIDLFWKPLDFIVAEILNPDIDFLEDEKATFDF